ncbi:hypothetical protein BDF20DRAFT_798844, partial [Mycotypha africana]|uniref:uncharacterized protein n=1 Tax=Mycotypha africana TaxID=64632 RepID=UPI002301ECBF
KTLGITTSDFLDLLVDIEKGYNDNPYHSFYHAVDVAMVLYNMLEEYNMSEHLTRFDVAMLILAGLCHDIGHPGNNNHFEVSCQTELAKQYNNLSVLESHSARVALDLFDKHDLLRNVELNSRLYGVSITKDEFKSNVVRMILATDMICHFNLKDNVDHLHAILQQKKHLHQTSSNIASEAAPDLKALFSTTANPYDYFKNTFFTSLKDDDIDVDELSDATTNQSPSFDISKRSHPAPLLNKQQRLMMCNILIHAADISNPCRPWPVFHKLSRLVCVEFFRQGDQERALGRTVTRNMDKTKTTPSKVNIGFIDFIVQPYFEALSKLFPSMAEFVERCKQNREEWLKRGTESID